MKHRFYKAVALLMALAMLSGLALSEEVPEEYGMEVDFGSEEENAGFEIDEEVIEEAVANAVAKDMEEEAGEAAAQDEEPAAEEPAAEEPEAEETAEEKPAAE